MEKQKFIGITIILMVLYTGFVILNPHTDKKTVFIKEDMDKIRRITVPEETDSTLRNTSALKAKFSEPVSTVSIQLDSSVLDSQAHRIRFKMAFLTLKSIMVNVSVIKILAEQPREVQSVGKLCRFTDNNKSSIVYVRVWNLRGERRGENYTDRVHFNVTNPYKPKEPTDCILGIIIHSFRYVYYEGNGKRGPPIQLGMKETVLFFLPFLLGLFGPFLLFCWKNWEELFM